MKGNAKRNGEARTRMINPHSVAGGTGKGRLVAPDPDDTSPRAERIRKEMAAFKPRRMTKAQARLERRTKQYKLYSTGAALEKRKNEGSYHEQHAPGSFNK